MPTAPDIDNVLKNKRYVNASAMHKQHQPQPQQMFYPPQHQHQQPSSAAGYYDDTVAVEGGGYIPMPEMMPPASTTNNNALESSAYISNKNKMIAIVVISTIAVVYSIYYFKTTKGGGVGSSPKSADSTGLLGRYLYPSSSSSKNSTGGSCVLCKCAGDDTSASPSLNLCEKHSSPSDKSNLLLLKSIKKEADKVPTEPVSYPVEKLDLYPQYRLDLRNALEARGVERGFMRVENLVDSLYVSRPVFDKTTTTCGDLNFFGTFEISDRYSAVLNMTQNDGENAYNEVVVYSYPEWKVVYANTKLDEIFFDSLKPGNYCLALFSVEKVKAVFTKPIINTGKPLPLQRSHRKTSQTTHEAREASIESVVFTTAGASSESLNVKSNPIFIWPGAVYTKVENINTQIPPNIKKLYITVPSFGFITEGSAEHIGSGNLVHEGDNTSIYRVVKDKDGLVNLTVVYPNVDPGSEVALSPSLTLYGFE